MQCIEATRNPFRIQQFVKMKERRKYWLYIYLILDLFFHPSRKCLENVFDLATVAVWLVGASPDARRHIGYHRFTIKLYIYQMITNRFTQMNLACAFEHPNITKTSRISERHQINRNAFEEMTVHRFHFRTEEKKKKLKMLIPWL